MNKTLSIGAFGKKEITFDVHLVSNKDDLIIFFHGCASSPYSAVPTNIQQISEVLTRDAIASCAFYESSRKKRAVEECPTDFFTFNKMKE